MTAEVVTTAALAALYAQLNADSLGLVHCLATTSRRKTPHLVQQQTRRILPPGSGMTLAHWLFGPNALPVAWPLLSRQPPISFFTGTQLIWSGAGQV